MTTLFYYSLKPVDKIIPRTFIVARKSPCFGLMCLFKYQKGEQSDHSQEEVSQSSKKKGEDLFPAYLCIALGGNRITITKDA